MIRIRSSIVTLFLNTRPKQSIEKRLSKPHDYRHLHPLKIVRNLRTKQNDGKDFISILRIHFTNQSIESFSCFAQANGWFLKVDRNNVGGVFAL